MERDEPAPRSVKDRIALLQQQTSPRVPLQPTASSTSPRAPAPQFSSLYNESSTADPTSPAKAAAIAGQQNINARPESPTTLRARVPSPANLSRGREDTSLQDTLSGQLRGRGGGGTKSATRTEVASKAALPNSPRSQSPAAPPLPRRSSTSPVDKVSHLQTRHQGPTSDPLSPSITLKRSSNPPPPPPRLPPRRASTLDPLVSTTATSSPSSPATSSISRNPNSSPSFPPNRSASVSSSSSSSASPQAPPLPRRKPTLPVSSSSSFPSLASPNISPRTPLSNSFEPPVPPSRSRPPPPSSKPTLNDPLSALPLSQTYVRQSNGSLTPRSSITNSASSSSNQNPKIHRPVDPRARKRYERLFYQCLDSIPPERGGGGGAGGGSEERIEGELVRSIWERSKLSRTVLREVWNEISPKSSSLDKEGFVRGMWLIDEELGRRQR